MSEMKTRIEELLDKSGTTGKVECVDNIGLIYVNDEKGLSEIILNSDFDLVRKSYYNNGKEIVIQMKRDK